jgi:flagellar biosynthesis anti-sigma factor FlgM
MDAMKILGGMDLSQLAGIDVDSSRGENTAKAKQLNAKQNAVADRSAELRSQEASSSKSDRVSLGLARVLRQELSVEAMAEERAEKVARIKELVQSGRYQVNSENVARSLAAELSFEIDAEKMR